MAVSMSAVLTIPVSPIIGRKFTCVLALVEGGGTATNLVSIQPVAMNAVGRQNAAQVRFGQVANALTIGNNTGAAMTLNASSTTYFNYEAVIDGPWMPNIPAEPQNSYLFGATCQTSDGSVFNAPLIFVAPAQHQSGIAGSRSPAPNQSLGQTTVMGGTQPAYANVASPGACAFDISANSYLIF